MNAHVAGCIVRAAASVMTCKGLGVVTPDMSEVVIREPVFLDDSDAAPLALTTEISFRIFGPFWVEENSFLR